MFHLNKETLQGHIKKIKKIKELQCVPFEVLDDVGDNAYRLSIPPYMFIYLVVDVENMKLYEPSMLDLESEQVLAYVEDLALEAQVVLVEYIVLQMRSVSTRRL